MSKFSALTEYEIEKLSFRGRGLNEFKKKVEDPFPYIEKFNDIPIKVLEIGCGFGQLLIDLVYKSKKDLFLYGVNRNTTDVDLQRAIKIAKFKKSVPENYSLNLENIHFLSFDAGKGLPFPDQSFDLIVSQVCIAYIPEKLFLIKEIKRLLTSEGTALLQVEFENFSDKGVLDENFTTLEIEDEKGAINLETYFNKYPGFFYVRRSTGSTLKIQGGGTIEFNAEFVSSYEFQDNDQHGIKSIYKIKK
jgi:SAM-dependent methyltransferase